MEIKPGVHFVGAFDPNLRTFDIIMTTANGTSYNSYLVEGSDGVAVVDTVKEKFQEDFFSRIEEVTAYKKIKYIILNHLEPDHSGALPELMKRAPQAEVVVSNRAKSMLKALVNENFDFRTVKGGETLSLGNKTLEFLNTPYLHWPETMMTYLQEDGVLFSCDVFGAHYYDERLFNDQVGDFHYAFKYYYDRIMRPYRSYVLQALDLLQKYPMEVLATSHGPVIRKNVDHYVKLYREWASDKGEGSELLGGRKLINVFYASSYGNTQQIAEAILSGLSADSRVVASMYDAEALDFERSVFLMEKSDAFLVGSPTINGDAVKPIWDLVDGLAYIESKGKQAAVFGSFGWSGEATGQLQERLRSLRLKLPMEPLKIKLRPSDDELAEAKKFGDEFARQILAQEAAEV